MPAVPLITILDDDESVRVATASLVRSLGYGARTFACAEGSLRSSIVGSTACVIADVQMPGMTCIELQCVLRARGDATPIVFVTAFPEACVRRRIEAAGAAGFLPQPFDAASLIACLDRALAARRGT